MQSGLSLPLRGEWIEIDVAEFLGVSERSLSLCGESGLKWEIGIFAKNANGSLPLRGEWIEIDRLDSGRPRLVGLSLCGESGLKCLGL